jgi:propanediol dehydratase small subunit
MSPRIRARPNLARISSGVLTLAVLTACDTPPPPRGAQSDDTIRLDASKAEGRTPTSTADGPSDAPGTPLIIGGEPVSWATLRPRLAEAAGGAVVDELTLEHALEKELRARGLGVTEADVRAERARWTELVGTETLAAQTEAAIRARRGLGPVRFDRLLWRNAALRKLVDPAETEPTQAEIRLAREIRTGTRYAVTGVVAPGTEAALRLADSAARSGSGATGALWSEASSEGLTPWHAVVSPVDPAYPQALRQVIARTPAGSASGVVALDDGFGVVVVHAEITGAPVTPSDTELRDELRIRKTRLAMERLAARLVERTSVHAMDRGLSVSG